MTQARDWYCSRVAAPPGVALHRGWKARAERMAALYESRPLRGSPFIEASLPTLR